MLPGVFHGKIFRRNSGLSRTAEREARKRDGRLSELAQQLPEAATAGGISPGELEPPRPLTYSPVIKILGVRLGETLGIAVHVDNSLNRSIVRHEVMAPLASTGWGWGLEAGVSRSTHTALITSLIKYGLVTFGSHLYEKQLDRLEVQMTNIAARRITGVRRSARPDALLRSAGPTSARSM